MKTFDKLIAPALALLLGFGTALAQNSAPAPGSGSIGGGPVGPIGPPPGGGWGNPWGPGWNAGFGPNYIPATVVINNSSVNYGKTNVVGCGYDATGVWRTIPMTVQYQYNGVQYNVIVLTAWNPWTNSWNTNLNVPAVNTSYYINGNNYNFYVVLSTGTFYFNL